MMEILAPLLGGLGLFMLGMALMTDGLKTAAGDALKSILGAWTRTRARGLVAGAFITAAVQSSSAVTVATIGFVNAGLLTLGQAIWVVFGANVGTTMTGWLVSQVGLKLDWGALALPLIGLGMIAGLALKSRPRLGGAAQAVAGFGLFFLGVGLLQQAFSGLTPQIAALDLEGAGMFAIPLFILVGALLTTLTQSSSAAMAITLSASAGGAVPLSLAAAAVIGANIGTTSTALLASIGATPAARRVAMAHVAFNAVTAIGALALLPLLLWASEGVLDGAHLVDDTPGRLAAFHTIFNLLGVLLILPLAPRLTRWLAGLFSTPDEAVSRPEYLDSNLLQTPSLAVRSLALECWRLHTLALDLASAYLGESGRRTTAPDHRREALSELAGAIRDFIDQLTQVSLPPESGKALADLVRVIQHTEELLQASAQLQALPAPRTGPALKPAWDGMDAEVRASLSIAADRETFTDTAAQTEKAFQSLKKTLLAALAEGSAGLGPVDTGLVRAQVLRRIALSARDGRQRLGDWLNGGEPEAVEPD
ncbi:Na/Pi cotransporter family protein [Glycocaulis alkaliphilus]|uniref:Na/Pi cotransporter family protein n=2 Tax=Glycocaulis alkaliphilus TaxID=1434191 RepID=A0A3T0E697_9PROT|nr:Na/Pi cotransporter family protein [Glycocaulis alkaliphilus]